MTSDGEGRGESVSDESALAARRLEAIGRLAVGIAHDFNNVLAAIRGHAQIALRSLDAIAAAERGGERETIPVERAALAQLRADVARMEGSAGRGAALTHQLSSLSRSGGAGIAPLDLNAFTTELGALVRRLIPAQIELALSLATPPVVARVDHSRLLQAMLELLLDARDALQAGGRIEIETSLADGPSPTAARQAAIAMRHSAPSTFAPGPGTHRALAELAAEVGGTVSVERDRSAGGVVLITLPAAEPGWPSPAAADVRVRAASGGATVLLVEDDPAVRRIALTVLERLGHRVVPAADGREALRLVDLLVADDIVLDLLVTDVAMPAMNGPELADEVRHRAPEIGVLFMSGMGDPAQAGGPRVGPRAAFLEKPFTLDDFAAQVARLLAGPE